MGWEFFDVVRFDLEPLLQGQTRIAKLKSAYNLLCPLGGGHIIFALSAVCKTQICFYLLNRAR